MDARFSTLPSPFSNRFHRIKVGTPLAGGPLRGMVNLNPLKEKPRTITPSGTASVVVSIFRFGRRERNFRHQPANLRSHFSSRSYGEYADRKFSSASLRSCAVLVISCASFAPRTSSRYREKKRPG